MDDIQAAFQCLGPVDFETFPANDPDELRTFICDLLTKSYQLAESVPPPPGADNQTSVGSVNGEDSTPDIAAWSRQWGKQINKVDRTKENPLGIPMYKMSSKGKGGTWFARRSVHEGLPFERWKEKLQGELQETVKMREQNGNDLATGSIRGIGCEKRLERIEVPTGTERTNHDPPDGSDVADSDGDSDKLGVVEVYHLSASFSGPSTPRDFVSLLVTSDKAHEISRAGAKSETNGNHPSDSRSPRTFILVSRPCKHPAAPSRKGFIRGEYESIEVIREVPENATNGRSEEDVSDDGSDRGTNRSCRPVEWIMVTRSDPGGSIPRWMIDKGTPPSILGDAKKFVDWAYHGRTHAGYMDGNQEDESSQEDIPSLTQRRKTDAQSPEAAKASGAEDDTEDRHIASLVEAVAGLALLGLEGITPRSFQQYLSGRCEAMRGRALDRVRHRTSPYGQVNGEQGYSKAYNRARSSSSQSSIRGGAGSDSDVDALSTTSTVGDGPKGKGLAKLDAKKRNIEEELKTLHQERDAINKESLPESGDDISIPAEGQGTDGEILHPQKGPNKATPAQQKRLKALETKQAKLVSRLEKISTQRRKIMAQLDAKQRKEAERNGRRNAQAELGKLREETTSLRKEVAELREERAKWLELVGRLQKENTTLVAETRSRSATQ